MIVVSQRPSNGRARLPAVDAEPASSARTPALASGAVGPFWVQAASTGNVTSSAIPGASCHVSLPASAEGGLPWSTDGEDPCLRSSGLVNSLLESMAMRQATLNVWRDHSRSAIQPGNAILSSSEARSSACRALAVSPTLTVIRTGPLRSTGERESDNERARESQSAVHPRRGVLKRRFSRGAARITLNGSDALRPSPLLRARRRRSPEIHGHDA